MNLDSEASDGAGVDQHLLPWLRTAEAVVELLLTAGSPFVYSEKDKTTQKKKAWLLVSRTLNAFIITGERKASKRIPHFSCGCST